MYISVCTIQIAYVFAITVYVMIGNNIKIAQFYFSVFYLHRF